MISPETYHQRPIFDAELERLFGTGFQFVGMASELANDRDFVCLDHAGSAIVVQNFKGAIKAFRNVCSHRFSKIQCSDKGNRPLTCRYHGWSYDASGFPYGMPKRDEYNVEENAETLRLTQYRVETCGEFVFVDLGGGGSLQSYLGDYYQVLEDISRNLGAQIHYAVVPHAANWKILVENVLDNHHCAILHRETFLAFGFCRLPLEEISFDGPHSSFHVPRAPVEREALRRRAFSHLNGRGYAHDSFYHALIFPNLFIASNEGMSFYVGHALPVAPDRTLLRVRYFEPRMDFTAGQRTRQDVVNEQTRANGLKIIEEDRPILEAVQLGAEAADKPGIVAASESRIIAFMDHYHARMSGREAAGVSGPDSAAEAEPAAAAGR